jgi:hypothetical protein
MTGLLSSDKMSPVQLISEVIVAVDETRESLLVSICDFSLLQG